MKYIYDTGKKFTLLLASLTLIACQNQQPASTSPPKTVDIEFELPSNASESPNQVKGPTSANVVPGDHLNFSVKPGSGAMLLIIVEQQSPFVNGDFTVKLAPGAGKNKKLEIASDRKGQYKYMIVDVSGKPSANTRPPLDPYIIVRK